MVEMMTVKIRKMRTPTKNKILFLEGAKNSPNQNNPVMTNYPKIWNTSKIGAMRIYLKQLLLLEQLHLDFYFKIIFFSFCQKYTNIYLDIALKNLINQMVWRLKKNMNQIKKKIIT